MSITCQITRQTHNKMRLDVPEFAAQPETSQWLIQFLLTVPGVAGVELQPASTSIIIRYDGAPLSRAAIVRALCGAQQVDAQRAIGQPAPTPLQPPASPYASCAIVHAMRGRVRLHLPRAGDDATLSGVLAHFLCEQTGVRHVRLNRYAANVVVAYDPAILDAQTIMLMVSTYVPDAAATACWRAAQRNQVLSPIQHARRRKYETILAAAALALTLFAGAPAVWLAYALLLGCAGSMVQRTYKSLHTDRKLRFEAIVAAAMTLVGLTGVLWAAALVPLAVRSAPYLRTWMQANATKTPAKAGPRPRSRIAQRVPARAIVALLRTTSFFGANLRKTAVMPASIAQQENPVPAPPEMLKPETVEPEQLFAGVSSLWSTAFIGSTTWFVHSDSYQISQKANE